MPGIARRPQRARAEVVEHGGRNAQEDHQHVLKRLFKDVLRRAHQRQHRPRQQHHGRRHDRRQRDADHRAIEEVALVFVSALGAEGLRQRDAEADARALHKAQRQEIERIGGAHRRQGVRADQPADHDRIDETVQLLKQRAQDQGQREQQNLLNRAADGQVHRAASLFHGFSLRIAFCCIVS